MSAEMSTFFKKQFWLRGKIWCVLNVVTTYNGPISTRWSFVPCVGSSKAATNLTMKHKNPGYSCYQIQCIARNAWESQQHKTTQIGSTAMAGVNKSFQTGTLSNTCCRSGKPKKVLWKFNVQDVVSLERRWHWCKNASNVSATNTSPIFHHMQQKIG